MAAERNLSKSAAVYTNICFSTEQPSALHGHARIQSHAALQHEYAFQSVPEILHSAQAPATAGSVPGGHAYQTIGLAGCIGDMVQKLHARICHAIESDGRLCMGVRAGSSDCGCNKRPFHRATFILGCHPDWAVFSEGQRDGRAATPHGRILAAIDPVPTGPPIVRRVSRSFVWSASAQRRFALGHRLQSIGRRNCVERALDSLSAHGPARYATTRASWHLPPPRLCRRRRLMCAN